MYRGAGRRVGGPSRPAKKKEVAGPYRSQSSVPSIRSKATRREHRKVSVPRLAPRSNGRTSRLAHALTERATITDRSGVSIPLVPTPEEAEKLAAKLDSLKDERFAREHWGSWEDDPPALEVLEIASLGIPGLGLVGAGAKATRGAILAERLLGASKAVKASKGAVRAATKAAPAGKAAKTAVRGARAASRHARRHPFLAAASSPVVAEVPGGDLKKGLEGTGRLAAALSKGSQAVSTAVPGIAGNALGDLVALPAYVLPSAFLTGKAGLEAAQGRPQAAEKLWDDFLKESTLPALATGQFAEAGSRAAEHPLYAALELAGVKAVVGRGAGAIARGGRAPEMRAPLKVYGDIAIPRGRYSKDAFNESVQRMRDRRLAQRGFEAAPRQKARYLDGRVDRTVFAGEAARKTAVRDGEEAMEAIAKIAGSKNADAVALAVQRIARNPDTAIADLQRYRVGLLAEQANLTGGRLRASQATVERVEKAIAHNDPEALVAAANEFIRRQEPVQAGLHERGVYDPEQTERASAIGFMRVHEGASHGKPEGGGPTQMLTREGESLSTQAIRDALSRQGAEPPGFVSNRPGELGRGAYYRPSTERPSGIGPKTTGKAVLQGTSNTDFDAITRQLVSGVSRLEQAKGFDTFTREYGLAKPDGTYFTNTAQARHAADNPDDFGMALPDVPGGWVPWRTVPWPTRTAELEAQRQHGHPAIGEPDTPEVAPGQGEAFAAKTVERALDEGDGPVVLIPKIVADRIQEHFKPKSPFERTGEAITGQYKNAILPTSPGWLAGNVADIWGIRTPMSGVTPGDILAGKGLERIVRHELTPDETVRVMESVVPGGFFGTRRSQPHRAYEQFIGHRVEPFWRAAATFRHAPGIEAIGNLFARYRDMVFDAENRFIERTPQYGALAKHVREELGMTRHQFRKAVRDMEPVVTDFVRGFRKQDNVDRAARSIEDIYGNWGKNGPDARRFLTTWAPFWMWLRAATKFAFVTLPRDHPALTAILAASEEMTREERQQFGLDFGAHEPLPDYLQGGFPTGDGGIVGASNLTTFGFFSNLLENSASMAAPQLSSGIFAAFGLDWKGDRLVDGEGRPAGQDKAALAAVTALGESFVPFLNVVKRTADKGFEGLLPARKTDPELVSYLRSLSQSRQINIPAESEGGGGIDYGKVFGGSGSSGIDYGAVFGGG